MTASQLFNEAQLLTRALKRWSEEVHRDPRLTKPMRRVLELILIDGPATVPQLARAEGVSRQQVQQQVDALLEKDFVARRANPSHRRSALVELSDKGRALIQNMRAEEQQLLSRLQVGVSDQAVSDATQVLAAWRTALVSKRT